MNATGWGSPIVFTASVRRSILDTVRSRSLATQRASFVDSRAAASRAIGMLLTIWLVLGSSLSSVLARIGMAAFEWPGAIAAIPMTVAAATATTAAATTPVVVTCVRQF